MYASIVFPALSELPFPTSSHTYWTIPRVKGSCVRPAADILSFLRGYACGSVRKECAGCRQQRWYVTQTSLLLHRHSSARYVFRPGSKECFPYGRSVESPIVTSPDAYWSTQQVFSQKNRLITWNGYHRYVADRSFLKAESLFFRRQYPAGRIPHRSLSDKWFSSLLLRCLM